MATYPDNNPYNIQSQLPIYIQYAPEVSNTYFANGNYPSGDESYWIWENQLCPVEHTVTINGVPTTVGAHKYWRFKVGTNGRWTVPNRMNGTDGAKGETGATGNTGPTGSAGADGITPLFEFSVNGTSGWHSTFAQATDKYMRISSDDGTTWTDAMLIWARELNRRVEYVLIGHTEIDSLIGSVEEENITDIVRLKNIDTLLLRDNDGILSDIPIRTAGVDVVGTINVPQADWKFVITYNLGESTGTIQLLTEVA